MELIEEKILKLPLYTEPLTSSDYENIFCNKKYEKEFIKFNGKIYHEKNTFFFINELIGEEVSKYFNLQTVDSIVSIRSSSTTGILGCDEILLLTELFTNKSQNYHDVNMFNEAKFYKGVGLDNIDFLYCYSPKNTTEVINISPKYYLKLQEDMKKLCVRDFITSQGDRHNLNFFFGYDKDKVILMPIFDYSLSFGLGCYETYFGYFDFDLELDKVIEYAKKDDFIQMLLKKAINMDMNLIIDKLKNKGIILGQDERVEYIDCVEEQKEAIIKARLIV